MNKNVLKLTTGAMCTSIFAVMLLLNRQTGMLFEEVLLFLFPMPMAAYSARYGAKSSVPVFFSMSFISIFFGTVTTIYYAASEAFIGLVFGSMLFHKVDTTRVMGAVAALSCAANLINTVILASIFGYDLDAEVSEMQTMINQVFASAGMEFPAQMASSDYLMRILIVSMAVLGLVQGVVICQAGIMILKRLKYHIPAPRSIFDIYPPAPTAFLAFLIFVAGNMTMVRPLADARLNGILQCAGICGFMYLFIFGMIGLVFFLRSFLHLKKPAAAVLAIVCLFFLSQLIFLCGIIYIATDLHKKAGPLL